LVFVLKKYCRPAFKQISQNAFFLGSWGSPACGLLSPKLNSHSGTSISIPFFQDQKIGGVLKTIKQTNQQPNNQAKTDEH